MNLNEKLSVMEAVLFACGEPVEIKKLAEICETTKDTVNDLAVLLNDRYNSLNSALQILRLDDCMQIATRSEYAVYIRQALESKHSAPLSNAAMEVLTIAAYNQPVTKGFVEEIRGVDSSSVVNSLVEKGLLEEAGRLDVPGRPVAYKTTAVFLRCFGLNSLKNLPLLTDDPEKLPLFEK